jgi:kumamolisin
MASAGSAPPGRVAIAGSERAPDPHHPRVGDPPGERELEVTVYLRASAPLDWVDGEAERPVTERRVLSREELASAHGAREDDIQAVRAFAAEYGLEVGDVDPARRSIALRGTVDALARAFGAQGLGLFQHPTAGVYRGRQGALTVPEELAGVITGVFGIDERPQARPHLRFCAESAQASSYTPVEVARAYGFPAGLTGAGQTVAVIELAGGYSEADLSAYFSTLELPAPQVTAVGVDNGSNAPRVNEGADGEVMLDIEVLGAVAPGASIVVYFANTSDQGFLDAVSTAVHDTAHKPSVVSISWGGPEDSWTQQARTQMEQILTEAAALGVTVTVAAGDEGSTDGVNDGRQHVDFPASAPHALACGGTSLRIEGAQIASETVWNDRAGGGAGGTSGAGTGASGEGAGGGSTGAGGTGGGGSGAGSEGGQGEEGGGGGATGGGVSIEFPLPSYQSAAGVPPNVNTGQVGRGVPDVSADADPETGYSIRVDGVQQTIGGTSAVAPLWAGLVALINQALGKPVGFLQPQLYATAAKVALRDVTQGDNGAYHAGPGWDACTGMGSPNGTALLHLLGGAAPGTTTPTTQEAASSAATPTQTAHPTTQTAPQSSTSTTTAPTPSSTGGGG